MRVIQFDRIYFSAVLMVIILQYPGKLSAQTWEWKNPQAGSNFIFDIEYISGSTFIQGGESGTIFISTDDGISWKQNFNPLGERNVKDIFIAPNGNIFVLGYGSEEEQTTRIIKTTDQGTNWSVIATNNLAWNKLWVFNDLVFLGLVNGGALHKTTDGGATFSDLILFGSSEHFTDIYFVDDSIGYASGLYGGVSKSTNGGDSWTNVSTNPNTGFYCMWFTDSNTGYFGSNYGRILKTTDGGVTFSIFDQQNFDAYYSMKFFDGMNGYAVGLFGNCNRTSNGGVTWVKEFEPASQYYDFFGLAIKSPGVVLTAGAYGNIFKRNNTPEWYPVHSPENNVVTSIDWADTQRGYATLSTGKLLKTSDGGETWSRLIIRDGVYAAKVVFANENQGTIFTSYDTLYYTANGGDSWIKAPMPVGSFGIVTAQFVTSSIGYAVGYAGTVLKSTNGGISWSLMPMSAGVDLHGVFFTSPDTGFATSYWAGTFRTTNGGISWTLIPGLEGVAYSIDFPTKLTGYSIGAPNYAFKTTDGGSTWFSIAFPFNNNYAIQFTDENTGYAAGGGGLVYKTTDGGLSWITERDGLGPSDRVIYDMDISPAGDLWLVSSFDGIHKKREGLAVPPRVSLVYPANFQPNTLLILLLRWNIAATSDYYELQISKTVDFSADVLEYTVSTTYLQMVREDLDFGTTYFWRVRGVNLSGSGDYSSVFQFTTYNPPIVLGDVDINGSVQAYDAGLVIRYVISAILLNKEQKRNANVTTDEFITAFDASVILRYTTGLITSLPYGETTVTPGIFSLQNYQMLSTNNAVLRFSVSEKQNLYALYADFQSLTEGIVIDSIVAERTNAISAGTLRSEGGNIAVSGITPLWEGTANPEISVYISGSVAAQGVPEIGVRYQFNEMEEKYIVTGSTTSAEGRVDEEEFSIIGNYPNPFNPETRIEYNLKESGSTEIRIFDILGKEVFRQENREMSRGRHSFIFDAKELPSGLYIVRIQSGQRHATQKMLLVK